MRIWSHNRKPGRAGCDRVRDRRPDNARRIGRASASAGRESHRNRTVMRSRPPLMVNLISLEDGSLGCDEFQRRVALHTTLAMTNEGVASFRWFWAKRRVLRAPTPLECTE